MDYYSFVFSIIVSRGLERFVLEADNFIEAKWEKLYHSYSPVFSQNILLAISRIKPIEDIRTFNATWSSLCQSWWLASFEPSASETPSIHSSSFPLFLFLLPITLLISGSCFEVPAVYLGFYVPRLSRHDALEYRLRVQSRLEIIAHDMQKYRLTSEHWMCSRAFNLCQWTLPRH